MNTTALQTIAGWRKGIRLYIGLASVLVTIEAIWWAQVTYGGTNLYATRLEEVFAWIALAMLALAVAIGPTYKLWPHLPGRRILFDARRLIGVGAAWFAALHAAIAYVSLFRAANPLSLPGTYQQSFMFGVVALVILAAMAFTSFDKAFKGMGIWWFRLHRLVYVALLASLFHGFLVGSHATSWVALGLLSVAALYIFSMHAYIGLVRTTRPTTWQILGISCSFLLLVSVFNFGYGQKLGYNPIEGKHHSHEEIGQ